MMELRQNAQWSFRKKIKALYANYISQTHKDKFINFFLNILYDSCYNFLKDPIIIGQVSNYS
jgi:hypothetical protein